jgi:hypothetical protein
MNDLNSYKEPTSELQTTARMVSVLAILTGVAYVWVFVEMNALATTESMINLMTAVCIVLASVGLILAFRWESWGGLLSIFFGFILMSIIYQTTQGDWLKVFFFSSPFIISGIFMLVSGIRNRKTV